jgi:serine/threonine-protein kinase
MTNPSSDSAAFRSALAGQYALDREIGRGGMGIVYLARDLKLDRLVAVKTLPPQLATDVTIRERFLREARTAAALSHPSIVPIHRADEMGGQVFFVMGFVDGESMAQRIRAHGALDPREVLRQLRDVALALDYAHSRGVVHRDIKAENILIDAATGRALVTDFGIARLAEATPLTQTGQVLGTVYYLSPEQVSGDAVDGRSDLYSLGVVGYFALSGRFPFDAELASAVLVAHVTRAAPPLATVWPDVPRGLAAIVDRCLAKDPAARFGSGRELADALTAIERDVDRAAALAPARETRPAAARVSDTEAQAIWQRAAQLQALTGVQPRPAPIMRERDAARDGALTSGYQVLDVRAAAAEAGIDPQYVEHALVEHGLAAGAPSTGVAIDVRDRSTSPVKWLTGGYTHLSLEIVVDGEMPERDFDLMVDIIRREVDEVGNFSAVGRSLTWNSMSQGRRIQVSVLPRGGKTAIRVSEGLAPLAGSLFGPIMGAGGGGLGGATFGSFMASGHPGLAAFGWLGILTAAYTVARTSFARASRRRHKTLRELAEALAEQARASINEARGSSLSVTPRGRA